MDDYPSNSRENREQPAKAKANEPKKVQKIVAGDVVRRKKTLGRRFAENFGGGNARSVISSIALDVLIPAAKETIADAFSQGVEKMIFGEARSTSRRGHRPGFGRGDYTPYNRMAPGGGRREPEPRSDPRRAAKHNFEDVILATRVEAEEVIESLYELVAKYDSASVADLNDLLGEPSAFTDNKWGWYDLHNSSVARVREGYLLDLPRPEPID